MAKRIYDIIESLHNNENPNYNFSPLHGRFSRPILQYKNEERKGLIANEPIRYNELKSWYYSYIAATVHQLCLKYNLDCPKWALSNKYILEEPTFAMDVKGDLRVVIDSGITLST